MSFLINTQRNSISEYMARILIGRQDVLDGFLNNILLPIT